MKSLEDVIAETLEVRPGQVSGALAYDEIAEWDSLGHVNLMLALESEYGVDIDEEQMVELTSVEAIQDFLAQKGVSPSGAVQ